jgi:hypothetical protein
MELPTVQANEHASTNSSASNSVSPDIEAKASLVTIASHAVLNFFGILSAVVLLKNEMNRYT